MNYSRRLNKYLRRTTPSDAVIKQGAHAATMAACALIIPSIAAIYYRNAGLKENEPYWVWAAVTIWKIHVVVIGIAVALWIFEKPRSAKYLPPDWEPLRAIARSKPWVALVVPTLLAFLLGWLMCVQLELAYDAWRWGRGGRAIWRVLQAVPFGLCAILLILGPALFVILWCRKRLRGDRNG